jgi:hypothetical protein
MAAHLLLGGFEKSKTGLSVKQIIIKREKIQSKTQTKAALIFGLAIIT